MIFAFGQAADDPGRREYGAGDTRFVAPAWHEGNTVASYVQAGDRVVDAYLRAGLADIVPPEGMLPCVADRMTAWGRWPSPERREFLVGYGTDKNLQNALARCWQVFATGPPTLDVTVDRITLASGLIVPSIAYQTKIREFITQGVSLERAYFFTGQSTILPAVLLPCMESMMQQGEWLLAAAMKCEQMPPVTLPIPGNGDGDIVVNGKEDKKGIPVTYFVIGALAVGLAIASRR